MMGGAMGALLGTVLPSMQIRRVAAGGDGCRVVRHYRLPADRRGARPGANAEYGLLLPVLVGSVAAQ